jgi:hypothetical protein
MNTRKGILSAKNKQIGIDATNHPIVAHICKVVALVGSLNKSTIHYI